jgi:Immunity protein Imm1
MKFLFNGRTILITTMEDLRQQLRRIREQQFSEVWLDFGDEGPTLTMLVNGAHAWLMYLRDQNGASGFSSRNPYNTNSTETMMQFRLSNGQMDEYPVEWTISLEDAFVACEYFLLRQGERSPDIVWHDD